MKRPPIFKYDNYRVYLKDWYDWMKETKPGFSYRAFSRWAGFKSPNQLMLVIKGERAIALKSIDKYLKVLGLKKTEKKYFELLVKFNQAGDMVRKNEYLEELSAYWLKRGTHLEGQQLKYLTNWYYAAIREMVSFKDFKENSAWIAKRLGGRITPAQARQAIRTLLELGLLKRDKRGRLKQSDTYVTTGNEVASVAAFLYHRQMIGQAMESLKEKPSELRNITALTFSVRKQDYDNLVEEINEFRKRVISLLQNRKEQDRDEMLYQLNIHLFPISEVPHA